jgi:hypothetical protein
MKTTLNIVAQALDEASKWKERGVQIKTPGERVNELLGREFHYMSFTALEKLGLNPSTRFRTPAGIYAYPMGDPWLKGAWLKSLQDMGRDAGAIQFASEQPFIQLFRVKNTDGMIVVNAQGQTIHGEQAVDRAIATLEREMPDEVKQALEELEQPRWRINRARGAQYLWLLTMFIAMNEVGKRGKQTKALQRDNQHIVRWTKLLLDLGIVGFEDRGSSMIHPSEPHQVVVFRMRDVEHLASIDNPLPNAKRQRRLAKGITDDQTSALTWAVEDLRDALSTLVGSYSAFDTPETLSLGGKIGDPITGEPYSIGQMFPNGFDSKLAGLFDEWTKDLVKISKALAFRQVEQEIILGLKRNDSASSMHIMGSTSKLTVINDRIVLVAGDVLFNGFGSAVISEGLGIAANETLPVYLTPKSRTKVLNTLIYFGDLDPVKPINRMTYPMIFEGCEFEIYENKRGSWGDSWLDPDARDYSPDRVREMIELRLGEQLKMDLDITGEFISSRDTTTRRGPKTNIVKYVDDD